MHLTVPIYILVIDLLLRKLCLKHVIEVLFALDRVMRRNTRGVASYEFLQWFCVADDERHHHED